MAQDDSLRTLEKLLTEGGQASDDERVTARLTETAEFFAFLRAQLPDLVKQWGSSNLSGVPD